MKIDEEQQFTEGGHRFPFVVKIDQENVKQTMANLEKDVKDFFGFTNEDYQFVGSAGKKLKGGKSGDIDLVIARQSLEKKFNITKPEEWIDLLKEFCAKLGIEVSANERWGWDGTSIAYPIANTDGEQENAFVQIDMVPTSSIKFQSWSQWANQEVEGEKFVKTLVRNEIMCATARVTKNVLETGKVNGMEGEQPIKWERYSYDQDKDGLWTKTYERPLMKGDKGEQGIHTSGAKVVDSQLASQDPDEICDILFGVKSADMITWDQAFYGAQNKGCFDNPSDLKEFKDSLRLGLTRAISRGNLTYLPPELEDFLGITVDSVPKRFEKSGAEPQIAAESRLYLEGGNMFDDTVRINQENVMSTLKYIYDEILPAIGIDRKYVQPLGSTGKKLKGGSSSDIDLGIDANKCELFGDAQGNNELEKALKDYAEPILDKMGLKSRYTGTLFSIRCPIQSMDGKQDGEFVQLDMMPTRNSKFQIWSQYAPREIEGQTYIKGAIRNLILEAAGHAIDNERVIETGLVKFKDGIREDMVEWEEYSFYTPEGLNIKHCTRPLAQRKDLAEQGIHNSGKTESRTLFSDDPDVIAKKMFGKKVKGKDILEWKGAWDAAHRADWAKKPDLWKKFIDALREKIQVKIKAGFNIPQEMLDELGLGGGNTPDGEPTNESRSFFAEGGIDTERTAMTKIHQLTGSGLRQFLQNFINGVNGSSLAIKATPKVDGQAYRIAWLNGQVFMELSKSGLMDKKGVENHPRLKFYEKNFYEYNEKHNAKKVQDFISSLGLDGIKVIGEILPNGEGLVDDNGTITYVGSSYDASKLGKQGTLVMFTVKELTESDVKDIDATKVAEIMDFLESEINDEQVQFLNIAKFAQEIDLNASDFPEDVISALKQTPPEKMKKAQAESIRDQINASLTEIMKRKFKNPDIMPEGDDSLEGVAFELGGKLYGVHYQSWKDLKQKYGGEMHEMDNIIKIFLAEITGGNANSTVLQLINPIRQNPEQFQDKYRELLPKFLDRSQELIQHSSTRTDIPRFINNLAQSKADNLKRKFNPELLTDDIMSFVELVDGKVVDQDGKTIALIPGSFRPPHKGHFAMVKHYAQIADEVIVGISAQNRLSAKRKDKFGREIEGTTAQKMMQIYCDAAGLDNVQVSVVSEPIPWISATIRHFKNCKVMLGLSKKDDTSRFAQFTEPKFQSTLDNVEILPIEENAVDADQMEGGDNISATYVRDNIDDKEALRKVLPSELNDAQFEEIYNMLNPKETMNEGHLLDLGEEFPLSRMNQENAQATLEDIYKRLLPEFGLSKEDAFPVGSGGKKLLQGKTIGDIDLAVDQKKIMKATGVETPEEFADFCTDVANKLNIGVQVKPGKGFTGTSFCWPIANVDGKQEGQFVQVDFVVSDNIKFTRWSYHQDDEQEVKDGELDSDINPKGIIKTELLQAIARGGHVDVQETGTVDGEDDQPVKIVKYDYNYRKGLYKITKTRDKKRNGEYKKTWNKNINEFMSGDPDEIVRFLFSDDTLNASDISSPRKVWDTLVNSILWKNPETRAQIEHEYQVLKDLLDFNSPTWVKFNEGTMEKGKTTMINEGGHAKTDCPKELKARINQENVADTLDDIYKRLLPKLGLTKDDVESVGSTGKKLPGGSSGDIDLAMPQQKIQEALGIETPDEFIDYCQDLFAELDVWDASAPGYGWKAVSCFWPIANTDGKQEGKFVQLDFVVTTNMRFITWGMHTDQEKEVPDGMNPEDVNPKTAIKLMLIRAAARGGNVKITKMDGDEPIEMERYEFVFNEGLYKMTRIRKPLKKGGYAKNWTVANKEFVTDDPDKIIHLVFHDGSIKADDLMTAKDVWDALIDSDMWEDPNTRHEIGRCFQSLIDQQKGKYGAPTWIKFD